MPLFQVSYTRTYTGTQTFELMIEADDAPHAQAIVSGSLDFELPEARWDDFNKVTGEWSEVAEPQRFAFPQIAMADNTGALFTIPAIGEGSGDDYLIEETSR